MALRLTEEEYADLLKRRALPCVPAKPSGVSVAHLRGSDLPGIAKESIPRVEHHDEIDAWAYAVQAQKAMEGAEKKARRSKYGNRRVEIDGMKFDSQKEADFYFSRLLPAWRLGELKLLVRQVPFDLPGGIKYVADFVIVGMNGDVDVIDTKSEATRKNRVYINKKKQMRAIWGIEIMEV